MLARKNCAKMILKGGDSSTVIAIYQTPLFSTQMVGTLGFDVISVFETIVAMCRANGANPLQQ